MSRTEVQQREDALNLARELLARGTIDANQLTMCISQECEFSYQEAYRLVLQMIAQGVVVSDVKGIYLQLKK